VHYILGLFIFTKSSGAKETRTPDLLRAREALSQLSYSPVDKINYINTATFSQFETLIGHKLQKRIECPSLPYSVQNGLAS
jgi:hypothetical protein